MRVIKSINNNTVCVVDEHGREQIVSGKGIGFGKKYGDIIKPETVQKTYYVTNTALEKKLIDMLSDIPYEYLKVTADIVEYIKNHINSPLNDSLWIMLSDHIAFAIERKNQGIEITNPLMDSIKECYPEELKLGYYCIEQIEKQLGVHLISDEAGFAAMHIVNARLDTKMDDFYDRTKMINGSIEIAEYFFGKKFDKSSAAYDRFTVHLKYLSKRLFLGEKLPEELSNDKYFTELIKRSCKRQYKCSQCIQEYLLKTFGKTITEDELITLTIHLKKVGFEKNNPGKL
ncbi:MAG: PRD domain-containing protein [bacterium]|nr:PRD domain-containing protein [bacterium]